MHITAAWMSIDNGLAPRLLVALLARQAAETRRCQLQVLVDGD